ncbi:MAG: DUF305 domain-containing protein [marine benthic group bacterium]|jgi:uncharacterized protein (DUF305 family)|nr:DUF305 domain-containing protein [Gemmatimonadota bacterium]
MTARACGRVAAALIFLATFALLESRPAMAQTEGTGSARMTEAEIEALYHARTDSARMRFSQADVDFVTGMIGHHAQALVMSELAPTHGASPQVQVLAARIINAQKDEIALMQQWLRDRGQPVPDVKIDGLDLKIEMTGPVKPDPRAEADPHGDHEMDADHDMGAAHDMEAGHDMAMDHAAHADHSMMPGMLTQAQLEELDAAYGPEFDRLFLRGMIHHHGGAVTMVHELFGADGAGQDEAVFKLASDVQVDQITEIERMKQMLEALEN